jgi:hypothetical protein
MGEQTDKLVLANDELAKMYSSSNVPSRIVLRLEGASEDGGHLRLSDLIEQLELLKNALAETERLITGEDKERYVYYRVVDLSHNSPARIVIEPAIKKQINPQIPQATIGAFFYNLDQIKEKKIPEGVDWRALEAYRDLSALLAKNSVTQVVIEGLTDEKAIDKTIDITAQFKTLVDELIGEDEIIKGSLIGSVEWLNIHDPKKNTFHIYPMIGAKKIVCRFPKKLKLQVIGAIDKRVEVYGDLRYKKTDNFPYAMNVEEIILLPSDEDLPTLTSLRGIAPQITGDLTAYEFTRMLRNESR